MSDYDNTNSGVIFKPFTEQKLWGQGRMNVEGQESRIVVVQEPVKRGGDPMPVVYMRVGPLFTNDKKGNDNAPSRTGPMDTHPGHRMAIWPKEKDGNKFFSMAISKRERQEDGGGSRDDGPQQSNSTPSEWDDETPF